MRQITAHSSHNNIATVTVKWREKRAEGGVGRRRRKGSGRGEEGKEVDERRGEERPGGLPSSHPLPSPLLFPLLSTLLSSPLLFPFLSTLLSSPLLASP